jgi:hypothetical protein
MREFSGQSTFVLGLRVDEDGDLRFAIGDSVIEIYLNDDDEPLAMREVGLAEIQEAELAPWDGSGELRD